MNMVKGTSHGKLVPMSKTEKGLKNNRPQTTHTAKNNFRLMSGKNINKD